MWFSRQQKYLSPLPPQNCRDRRTVFIIKIAMVIYHSLRVKSLRCIAYLIPLKRLLDTFIFLLIIFFITVDIQYYF